MAVKIWSKRMNEYKIELIHEPSGAYMNFVVFSEVEQDGGFYGPKTSP